MNPCLKQDDIQEIKTDVKEVKELLNKHLIRFERQDAEIGIIKKVVMFVLTFVVGLAGYVIEKKIS